MPRNPATNSVLCLLAAAWAAAAQVPSVREINLYGLRKVPSESILHAAKIRSGEPLPPSKGDVEELIAQVPGVLRGRLEAVCCQDKNAILFVGIEERDGPHVVFHPQPTGNATLPEGVMDTYQQFLAALRRSAQSKPGSEAVRDPALKVIEEKFTSFATGQLAELRDTLHHGGEAEERAAAVIVMGYAPGKTDIAADLQYAMRDPDESVRSNAIRSLHAALVAADSPTQTILVPLTTLVDLLHSIVLSYRLEAADMLVSLTDDGNREALALMRAQALPELVEMARWESLRYALRPYILVGRIAGFSEPEMQKWWESGEREHVIQKALALPRQAPATAPRKQPTKQ